MLAFRPLLWVLAFRPPLWVLVGRPLVRTLAFRPLLGVPVHRTLSARIIWSAHVAGSTLAAEQATKGDEPC